jgi:hypothetical protein
MGQISRGSFMKMVALKNNSEVPEVVMSRTMRKLQDLWWTGKPGVLALTDLHKMCKGTMPCASGDNLETLKEHYLIHEDGRIPEATREVVLSAFEEKGPRLKLGWPVARQWVTVRREGPKDERRVYDALNALGFPDNEGTYTLQKSGHAWQILVDNQYQHAELSPEVSERVERLRQKNPSAMLHLLMKPSRTKEAENQASGDVNRRSVPPAVTQTVKSTRKR